MLQAQIFIDKDDLINDGPLYDFILEFLLDKDIAGATAFVALSGFGIHRRINRPERGFSFDETPMVITFVDEAEKVKETLKELRKSYSGGFITTHVVEHW